MEDNVDMTEIIGYVEAERFSQAGELLKARLKKMSQVFCVSFACRCAHLVLPTFEAEKPGDNRPRAAIEAAERWIMEPTEKNKKVTDDAAYAATDATYATSSYVAYAAYASSAHAAYAVSDATVYADHAAHAAYADHASHAFPGDRKAMWLKCLAILTAMERDQKLSQI
jgi:hypothetical protein